MIDYYYYYYYCMMYQKYTRKVRLLSCFTLYARTKKKNADPHQLLLLFGTIHYPITEVKGRIS